jgi:hypothetical protein
MQFFNFTAYFIKHFNDNFFVIFLFLGNLREVDSVSIFGFKETSPDLGPGPKQKVIFLLHFIQTHF